MLEISYTGPVKCRKFPTQPLLYSQGKMLEIYFDLQCLCRKFTALHLDLQWLSVGNFDKVPEISHTGTASYKLQWSAGNFLHRHCKSQWSAGNFLLHTCLITEHFASLLHLLIYLDSVTLGVSLLSHLWNQPCRTRRCSRQYMDALLTSLHSL